ncbi:MAG: outer membrane beta-barrel protein [Cyclobacteriaceae bacterium]
MKKIIVLIVFVAGIATSGYSQFIKQGTIIGGGSFEFKSHKDGDSDNKRSTLSLMPWAGYMVIDNFAAGALLSVSTQTFKYSSGKDTDTGILFGPVARYYLDNGLFAHGQFAFGSSKSKSEIDGSGTFETKFSTSELRIGAGYAARITDTILFEPIVGFLSESNKNTTSNVKNTESGFFIMAGFTIFFHSTN